VVKTELVLPVAVGHPDVDVVAPFPAPHRLRSIEGQADRLGGDPGMRMLAIAILALLALAITLPRTHQFAPLPTRPMPAVMLPDKQDTD
jgi:hypothetical protein